ncbi:hypothetical protein RY831_17525 [Noviherbaspirillum sp. CPCC 100848]|uniref:Uncharacterized protein n=1 Tax=Noviherbaspirillum album TaxID=3080276 RepID=A0ABU6JCB5_9BURK|nr:hypothetical protein [Noviherbaspirillum sp. CPCC 100848]MEC4720970.1 hypothetical protein [Noviherbaspirillum sp. CPCC 100848]
MTSSVTSNGSITKYDSFPASYNLPDPNIPALDEKLMTNLIGNFDPGVFSMLAKIGAGSAWEKDYNDLISKGDGNAAVAHIIKGLKEGKISKEDAIEFAKQVQQGANANGGGKINGGMRDALKEALGTDIDHIAKGKTRATIGFEKFLKGLLSIIGL